MLKSTYKITKMDCPSEESMIRMKLDGQPYIENLIFDIENRKLTVFHTEDNPEIGKSLESLNLGASRIETISIEEGEMPESHISESNLLWIVLIINFTFFIVEMTTGIFSRSMGLVADSLDMLADSFVYGLSILAVGASALRKKRVATLSGYFQLLLAAIGLIEVVRRFIFQEGLPDFKLMIVVSIFALIANAASLYILKKSKSGEAHMKASMIFTSNDVIINIGVIFAGILVFLTGSKFPDLIIGAIVFIIVVQGALRILKLGK